jgi:hypothetical protein
VLRCVAAALRLQYDTMRKEHKVIGDAITILIADGTCWRSKSTPLQSCHY